jgi:hypothetical protein
VPDKPALLVGRTLIRGENGPGWLVGASIKSGKDWRVRLTRPAVTALKDHRKRQLEERMRLSRLWQDQRLTFPNEIGHPLNRSDLRNRSFKRIMARQRSGRPTLTRSPPYVRHALPERRSQREGSLRDARPRLYNHHPQHLLSRFARHAGLRRRRDRSGVGSHVVRLTRFRVAARLQQKGRDTLPDPLYFRLTSTGAVDARQLFHEALLLLRCFPISLAYLQKEVLKYTL